MLSVFTSERWSCQCGCDTLTTLLHINDMRLSWDDLWMIYSWNILNIFEYYCNLDSQDTEISQLVTSHHVSEPEATQMATQKSLAQARALIGQGHPVGNQWGTRLFIAQLFSNKAPSGFQAIHCPAQLRMLKNSTSHSFHYENHITISISRYI